MKQQILIIEDDPDIREGVRILLEGENYQVLEAENGSIGLSMLTANIDLVILDIMMPGISGLRTCEEIRKTSNVPILFLTAKARESDKLIGLMAGGDDYLTKPFSFAELLGRIKALTRRYRVYMGKETSEDLHKDTYIRIGDISLNRDFNEVLVQNKPCDLPDIEYHMLKLMMEHPRKIFSAQNLYESVWNEPFVYTCAATVTVHIRGLRLKIETDPSNPVYIRTVWGKGYKFDQSGS